MKPIYSLLLIVVVFYNCNSTKIIQQYKNAKTDYFLADKILVIGLGNDVKLRTVFEEEMVIALKKEGVNAVASVNYFENSFTEEKQSMADLSSVENKLLSEGFDAILLTKVTGKEKRFKTSRLYYEYMKSNQTFEDYYYGNQYLYMKEKGKKEDYVIYFTETSLYCICPEKERELLWRSDIEIKEVKNIKSNVKNYIKTLFFALTKDELLFYK